LRISDCDLLARVSEEPGHEPGIPEHEAIAAKDADVFRFFPEVLVSACERLAAYLHEQIALRRGERAAQAGSASIPVEVFLSSESVFHGRESRGREYGEHRTILGLG
jgi:hypothetical protein